MRARRIMRMTYVNAALLAGLIAGTLDIGAAALINWVSPHLILRAIARGLLGKAAPLTLPVMGLGLVLQWAMSIVIAGIFMLAASRAPILTRNWVLAGIGYGLAIFVVMNWVVVPLSALHAAPHFKSTLFMLEHMTAMVGFGLIVAWFAHRASLAR